MESMNQTRNDLFSRKGSFSISEAMIEAAPEAVMRLMSKVIIVRAEASVFGRRIYYQAYSPWFDRCSERSLPLEYQVETNGVDCMFWK